MHRHSPAHLSRCSPQLRLAQVSHEFHDRISATPRFEALSELNEHCNINMSKDRSEFSPAERLFLTPTRHSANNCIYLYMPFSEVRGPLLIRHILPVEWALYCLRLVCVMSMHGDVSVRV